MGYILTKIEHVLKFIRSILKLKIGYRRKFSFFQIQFLNRHLYSRQKRIFLLSQLSILNKCLLTKIKKIQPVFFEVL